MTSLIGSTLLNLAFLWFHWYFSIIHLCKHA